jgi:hypothetical protein
MSPPYHRHSSRAVNRRRPNFRGGAGFPFRSGRFGCSLRERTDHVVVILIIYFKITPVTQRPSSDHPPLSALKKCIQRYTRAISVGSPYHFEYGPIANLTPRSPRSKSENRRRCLCSACIRRGDRLLRQAPDHIPPEKGRISPGPFCNA